MSYFPGVKDFGLEVSKGTVFKTTGLLQEGRNTNIGTSTTPQDIWVQGGIWVPPTTARVHDLVSTSANDTASAGTGAQQVTVYGLDSGFNQISEGVNLNGTTPASTSGSYTFIQRIDVNTVGSDGHNDGIITATAQTDNTISATIAANYNTTQLAIYQVPTGYTAYIYSVVAGMQNATANNTADLVLLKQAAGGNFYKPISLIPLENAGSSTVEIKYASPLILQAQEIIKAQCTKVSANSTEVHASLNIFLIQN